MKILKSIFVLLGLVGLGVSSYLTYLHYTRGPAVCGVFSDCETVLRSSYSEIMGTPLALLGIFFYLTILSLFFILIFKKLDLKKKEKITKLIFWLELTGVIFSAYFTYLQFFVIKAFCPYCLTSALATFLLFLISWELKKMI